jgi:hypothetical protein
MAGSLPMNGLDQLKCIYHSLFAMYHFPFCEDRLFLTADLIWQSNKHSKWKVRSDKSHVKGFLKRYIIDMGAAKRPREEENSFWLTAIS